MVPPDEVKGLPEKPSRAKNCIANSVVTSG